MTVVSSPGTAADEEERRSSVVPMTTWLPPAVTFAAIAVLAARATGPITDPDTWWHLRLGSEFRSGWSLSDPDQLSPFADSPWVPTQWLTEVVASVASDLAGLAGVAWLTGLAVVLLGGSLWWLCRAHASQLPAALAVAATLAGVTQVLAPRPQIISLILLALFVGTWLHTAEDLRPRWWLVPATWLWASIHGFWFVGGLVGFAVVAGLVLDRRLNASNAIRLAAVPVVGVVAAALTPVGPTLLLAPFQVSKVAGFITEWQPPDFSEVSNAIVALMMIAVVLTLARRGQASWVHLALLCSGAFMMLYSGRTVALAAVFFAPLLALAIQQWVGEGAREAASSRERRLTLIALAAAIAVTTLVTWWRPPYDDSYPDTVQQTLAALPSDAVIFNDYRYGGWLAWQYPDLTHGIDGMTEAYSPRYIADYARAATLQPGWRRFLDRIGATHAFLGADDAMSAELENHLDWEVLVKTSEYVVLRRPAA